ncbi:MAG: hypothetical protein HJJLKODD_02303 [Phycisphaerae bacterium]|nr:hypothetical protein [Phycisphaerae bacterium]
MVTARQLLEQLQRQGVRFSVHCNKLRANAPTGILTTEVKTAIGHLKPQLITMLTPIHAINHPDQLPEHWRELYEERAGIMEYDANMNRQDAEDFALIEITDLMNRGKQA